VGWPVNGTADVLAGIGFIAMYFGTIIGGAWIAANIFGRKK